MYKILIMIDPGYDQNWWRILQMYTYKFFCVGLILENINYQKIQSF